MNEQTAPSDRHTPGPWKAHQGWADHELRLDAEEYPHWCEVTGQEGPNGHSLSINGHFGIANANLIAAAPELLEACKNLLAIIEAHEVDTLDCDRRGEKYCNCLSNQIRRSEAAIAKAEGRTE